MGLLTVLQNQLDKAVGKLGYIKQDALTSTRTLFGSEVYPGQEYDVYANYAQNEWYKLGMSNYAIARNVRLIGDIVAGGKTMIQERDDNSEEGWNKVKNHEFNERVDYNPNPFMSQSFIWKYQVTWILLAGESYWLDFLNRMGSITALYPLPANRVKPIPSAEKGISSYAYTPIDGQYPQLLEPGRVCFHRFPNPFEYWRGLSPLSAYLASLKIMAEAQKTDLEDYKNGLSLQHLISVRSGMSDREFNVAMTDLQTTVEAGKRWKMIRAGEMKIDSTSQGRNQYSDQIYKISESQANYIYGIPDAYWSQEKAYKQGDAYNQLINDTIWPLMNLLAEDLTVQYIWPTYGNQYRLMFEDIRPKNIELELKQTESLRVIQTFNEAREKDGLDPHPDPDIGFAPVNVAGQIAVEKVKMGQPIDGTANVQDEINAAVQAALAQQGQNQAASPNGQIPGDQLPLDGSLPPVETPVPQGHSVTSNGNAGH